MIRRRNAFTYFLLAALLASPEHQQTNCSLDDFFLESSTQFILNYNAAGFSIRYGDQGRIAGIECTDRETKTTYLKYHMEGDRVVVDSGLSF